MNTQLNTRALALAGAAVFAIVNILCFAVYAVVGRPDPWMELFLGSGPSFGGWLIGIAWGAVMGALIGGLVAVFYNRWAKPTASAS
jgi:hypothetical protein